MSACNLTLDLVDCYLIIEVQGETPAEKKPIETVFARYGLVSIETVVLHQDEKVKHKI